MDNPEYNQAVKELEQNEIDQELFDSCLKNAEGDDLRAKAIYLHRRSAELKTSKESLDEREKWPTKRCRRQTLQSRRHGQA